MHQIQPILHVLVDQVVAVFFGQGPLVLGVVEYVDKVILVEMLMVVEVVIRQLVNQGQGPLALPGPGPEVVDHLSGVYPLLILELILMA